MPVNEYINRTYTCDCCRYRYVDDPAISDFLGEEHPSHSTPFVVHGDFAICSECAKTIVAAYKCGDIEEVVRLCQEFVSKTFGEE